MTPNSPLRSPLVIVGPTASGKSSLAMNLATKLGRTEIVSADAMAVYRRLDIGTAKPTHEERKKVPHHLVDMVDPEDDYTMARFQAEVHDVLAAIKDRGNNAIVVGGTGLYVQAVVDNFAVPDQFPELRARYEAEEDTAALWEQLVAVDTAASRKMQPTNRRRIIRALEVTIGSKKPFSSYGPGVDAYPPTGFVLIGMELTREILDERIDARFRRQLDDGWLAEVESLRSVTLSRTAQRALGYSELRQHLDGELTLEQAIAEATRRTRKFARRQQRWFRRDPRITWLDAVSEDLVEQAEQTWSQHVL